MCVESKARHAYLEMNDISLLRHYRYNDLICIVYKEKIFQDIKAINYRIYIFLIIVFLVKLARLWQILVLKKRKKKEWLAGYACIFFFISIIMYWLYIIDDARKLRSRKSATVYRDIFTPVLFLPFLPSLSGGEFKSEQIPLSKIISFLTQLHMGEFKMGGSLLQV